MRTFWENDSEPLAAGEHAGEYAATVDLEDGSPVSRYYGHSHKEVADKLLVAQGNASQRIRELRSESLRGQQPDALPATAEFRPRELTADERYNMAQNITDPVHSAEVIEQVVEAKLGAPLETLRARLAQGDEEKRAASARAEALAFAEETPDYFACPHNITSMLNYMKHRGLAYTRKNFAIAFEELKAVKLIVFAPSTENPATIPGAQPATATEPTAQPTTRPRLAASTGLRAADASANARPTGRAEKYTLAQIEAMSTREYRDKVSGEPGFREMVDRIYATPARR